MLSLGSLMGMLLFCLFSILLFIMIRYLKSKGLLSYIELSRPIKQFDFYLAGGMRGHENKNKDMFLKVATLLREQGHTVFNPGEVNDDGMTFEECMRIDLNAVINRCKNIAFLPGWRESLGANTEALVAAVCGKKAYQVRLIKKDTQVKLREISLAKRTLPYKTKRRS